MTAAATADEFDAEVIAAFGRHLLVRDRRREELRARPAGRSLSIVCGDRVRCEVRSGARRSAASSKSCRDARCWRAPTCAAKASRSSRTSRSSWWWSRRCPQPDFFIVDRYLCAATAAGIAGAVAVNKSDLDANKLGAARDRRADGRGLRARRLLGQGRARASTSCARCSRARSACSSANRASASRRS